MKITVEDYASGEIRQKLPEIVAQLLQLDAQEVDGADLEKGGAAETDAVEDNFQNAVTLGMFRRARAVADARMAVMRRDVLAHLDALHQDD